MKFEITSYPNSYLKVNFEKNEKIIIEKGCFISSSGEYNFENKIEAKGVKNILANFLSDKNFIYSVHLNFKWITPAHGDAYMHPRVF